MNIISLFSGCGGLDLGFAKAGFKTVWANEFDKTIWETFEFNHKDIPLNKSDIRKIDASQIPSDIDGLIGGPPCQSFSLAGKGRGELDDRGQLFLDYIRILKAKQPKFFVAENVAGLLQPKHKDFLDFIVNNFIEAGYNVSYQLLNANDFDVPQDRKRVIFVGYRNDVVNIKNKKFEIKPLAIKKPTLYDAIYDLKDSAIPAKASNKTNGNLLLNSKIANHEYFIGGFSSMFMSRNRVRNYDEPSFTIQAGGRHAPLHPNAPKMELVAKDKRQFVVGQEHLYRRLSVREVARIQTFPDSFIFKYNDLTNAYKMIGNAVPVNLAYHIAKQIKTDLY